jgi:hypothetical protein
LEDKFVQVQLELLFVSSCIFLELEKKFVQVESKLLFVSSHVFLEFEDKFVQVQLKLLFVSCCVFLKFEEDNQMMEDFLGVDYTMDEIKKQTYVQHCGEEVIVVKYLVALKIVKSSRNKSLYC